ncbi:MAG: DNA recombination protein RmuC [Parvibaculum sp.]|uniref:DNA recombination protein RmuC n=1 Tax=Parvibaculum sp. TaxID=2024848 RepID=UPI003C76AFC7
MENWTLYLSLASGFFSLAAAIFAFLAFRRSAKEANGEGIADEIADKIANVIRTETDRVRSETQTQALLTRQELGDNLRGFQDSLAQRLDSGIEAIRTPVATIGQKLDHDMARMEIEAAKSREALGQSITESLDAANQRAQSAARELREELTGNFAKTSDQLAATLLQLGGQQRERLEKVEQGLALMTEGQGKAQEALRQAVENRLDAIRQENTAKLEDVRKTVDEKLQTTLEKRIGDSFRTVSEQLERVYQGLGEMQALATGVGDLKRVLTNVKTRGTWGEVQLGMLLEQFLSPDQFIANAQVKAHSAERVEFAVRFPGRDNEDEILLPIDAKFPQEDYERLVLAHERADLAAIEEAAAALETRVRSFAKSISEKYINPPRTTDFAILFLPTESLFAEVLRRTGLFDDLQQKYRVTVAGPTTLSALLSAFQMGFRSMAIQKRSSEVWQLLSAVRSEFEKHGKVVDKLKSQLNAATNTIDSLGMRTRVMSRKLKDVEVMTDESAQTLLGLNAPGVEDMLGDLDADETADS